LLQLKPYKHKPAYQFLKNIQDNLLGSDNKIALFSLTAFNFFVFFIVKDWAAHIIEAESFQLNMEQKNEKTFLTYPSARYHSLPSANWKKLLFKKITGYTY